MNATGQPGELWWHVHHNLLFEPLTAPVDVRREVIVKQKPLWAVPIRLRLLAPVRGEVPEALAHALDACRQAMAIRDRTRVAYDQAAEAYYQAGGIGYQGMDAVGQTWDTYKQATTDLDSAWFAYEKERIRSLPQMEALHKKECPDCPWDGESIFPDREGA